MRRVHKTEKYLFEVRSKFVKRDTRADSSCIKKFQNGASLSIKSSKRKILFRLIVSTGIRILITDALVIIETELSQSLTEPMLSDDGRNCVFRLI